MSSIELIGESGDEFLFAYKDIKDVPERYRNKPDYRVAFVYSKGKYSGCSALGSIIAHNPYWDKPSATFTDEELNRIALMLPEKTCTLPGYIDRQIAGIQPVKERESGGFHECIFAFVNKDGQTMEWGFLYSKGHDKEVKYGVSLLDALYEHEADFVDSEADFTESELLRITELEITGYYSQRYKNEDTE